MTCRILLAVPALLLAACSHGPAATPTRAPAPLAAPQVAAQVPKVQVDPAEADAEALLLASAMSYLGKTAAEFDGMTMVLVEYDPELLLGEAFADPGFRALVAAADADPHDGVLTTLEAERLETSVLAGLEG